MKIEYESVLENNLIEKLINLGYQYIKIKNNNDLKLNLKKQIEKFNNIKLKEQDFNKIYNYLNRGDIFKRAIILREETNFTLDNGNIIRFFDNKFCKNYFQVANQIKINSNKIQRYDVTLFINGFPLVQIELKKKGINLEEAFKQCHRYKMNFNEMFKFIQIFIISNGSETKYFATNNKNEDHKENNYKFSFNWTDQDNKSINFLLKNINKKESFCNAFLNPCHLSNMIFKYMVIQKESEEIKILRPYQFYAIKKILEKIKINSNKSKNNLHGGYIWHTTGSGKTLTSFKTVQLIRDEILDIKKILFVVDRKDLDSQTTSQFNDFARIKGEIKSVLTTNDLQKELFNDKREIIITTIQKLNKLLKEDSYIVKNNSLKNEKVVMVFDEAHRSQSGEISANISNYFNNLQIFGFTGTPIFKINNINNRTTEEVFGKELHHYTIYNAINDKNVLGFSVEYFKTFDQKKGQLELEESEKIIEDKDLNKEEIWNNQTRIKLIVEKIFEMHNKKTHKKNFNALLVTSSINMLKIYYDFFSKINQKLSKDKKIKVSAIFSLDKEERINSNLNKENFLKEIVKNFNVNTENKIDLKNEHWYDVYRKKLLNNFRNNKNIDIVIVVNMLTTGFDSQLLNTVYVDKNLQYHTLIQTFSRANRIYDDLKDTGQIISFRPIRKNVEEAIKLFADTNADTRVLKKSYEAYLKDFNNLINQLNKKYQNYDQILSFKNPSDKIEFIELFKEIITNFNMLQSFTVFKNDDLNIEKQPFEELKNTYSTFYKEQREDKEKISGLSEINFKIELLGYEKIDSLYIEKCLKEINQNYKDKNHYIKNLEKLTEDIKKSNYSQKLIDLITDFINKTIEDIINKNEIINITINNLLNNLENKRSEMIKKLISEENLNEQHIYNVADQYQINENINIRELRKAILPLRGKERIKKQKKISEKLIDIFNWTQI
ncbi:/ hsdR / type I restriction enzyme r protein /:348139 Forward [Candidatus Hepatoplasma crinochetorum]|uniref:Type I restriction enzyme endonuclease subunit n=1 Tax=Candidatus Hepatoplasma crinochetorum TaxID=295596 RepID=A0A0G7ZMY9_9MOLU|nr:/ hsdR / type I restriction enzyme r protein /:348139 Forward [Candidatus Hepatoplasma crinochetorum]